MSRDRRLRAARMARRLFSCAFAVVKQQVKVDSEINPKGSVIYCPERQLDTQSIGARIPHAFKKTRVTCITLLGGDVAWFR